MAGADVLNGLLGGVNSGVGLYNALRLAPIERAKEAAETSQLTTPLSVQVNGQTYQLPENLASSVLGSQAYGGALINRMLMGDAYRNGAVDSSLQNKIAAVPTYQALMNAAITTYQAHQQQQQAMQTGNPALAKTIGSQIRQELARNPLLEPYVAQSGGNLEILFNKIRGQLGTEVSKVQTGSGQFVTDEEALKQFNNSFPEFNDPQPTASAAFNLAANTYIKGTYDAAIQRTMAGQNAQGGWDNPELGIQHDSFVRQRDQNLAALTPFPGSDFSRGAGRTPGSQAPAPQPMPQATPRPGGMNVPLPGAFSINTSPGAPNLGAAAPLWGFSIPGAPSAPAASTQPLGPLPAAATGMSQKPKYQILSVGGN